MLYVQVAAGKALCARNNKVHSLRDYVHVCGEKGAGGSGAREKNRENASLELYRPSISLSPRVHSPVASVIQHTRVPSDCVPPG